MRNLILILFLITFISCDDDDLTEINNDGTGGISCLIDGELLRPSGGGIYGNRTARLDSYSNGTNFIILGLTNRQEKFDGLAFLTLLIYDVDVENLEGQVFQLKDEETPDSYGEFKLGDFYNNFATNLSFTGELEVLHYDPVNYTISGTFWFTGENENGETIEITDGRFDMRL